MWGENVKYEAETRKFIQSDAINKNINPEKQSRHDINSDGYQQGRSYLLPGIDAQALVNIYHGTGEPKFNKSGEWKNREVVDINYSIGILVNPHTNEETITNSFTIHYSKTGAHVVPAPRKD